MLIELPHWLAEIPLSNDARFRLDDARVRELLMGENLYGDVSLAVRELYQNAVDACRVLDARRSFLRLPPVEGARIRVAQGTDETGRRFIQCSDNGVGMDLTSFISRFCAAGARAEDSADWIAELGDYAVADPPIDLWTNSRFGIGALSYFMIAESIEVVTTPFERDGTLGKTLRVAVRGPGNPLSAWECPAADSPGTLVRLYLRDSVDISALITLRDHVIVCPYEMLAEDLQYGTDFVWEQGVLNTESRLLNGQDRAGHIDSIADPGNSTWWVAGRGGVIVDGVWAGTPMRFAVVNLTGHETPPMTVDRRSVRELPLAVIRHHLLSSVPALAPHVDLILQEFPTDIETLTSEHPPVADALVEHVDFSDDVTVPLGPAGRKLHVQSAGYVAGADSPHDAIADWLLSRSAQWSGGVDVPSSEWVTNAVRPRPSDGILLGRAPIVAWHRRDQHETWVPQVRSALQLYIVHRLTGQPLDELMGRLDLLGLGRPKGAVSNLDPNLLPLLDGVVEDEVRLDRPLPAFWVFTKAQESRCHFGEWVEMTLSHGIEVTPEATSLIHRPPSMTDRIVASRRLDGRAPWLSLTQAGPDHVMAAAKLLSLSQIEVEERLTRLGIGIDLPTDTVRSDITDDDLIILSEDQDGVSPWISPTDPVPWAHVRDSSAVTGSSTTEITERLQDLGYDARDLAQGDSTYQVLLDAPASSYQPRLLPQGTVIGAAQLRLWSEYLASPVRELADVARRYGLIIHENAVDLAPTLGDADLLAASEYENRQLPCRALASTIGVDVVVSLAVKLGDDDINVVSRLSKMGYSVRWPAAAPRRLTHTDRVILRSNLVSDSSLLDPTTTVSASHIVDAALITGRSVSEIVALLTSLGYAVRDPRTDLPLRRPGDYPLRPGDRRSTT